MTTYLIQIPVIPISYQLLPKKTVWNIRSKEQADAIFQIISKRTEAATTLVTTNLVPSDWGKIFDGVTATAILDRLSMNGKFITFEGRSYRRKK
jgi:DNA replication protein DnaC